MSADKLKILHSNINNTIYIKNKRNNIYTGKLTDVVNSNGEYKLQISKLKLVKPSLKLERPRYGSHRVFPVSSLIQVRFSRDYEESKVILMLA